MKKLIVAMIAVVALVSMSGCSKVQSGYVGVKVNLLGGSKGVDTEELGVGRYWIGFNEELHLFPTFTQNYVWTKDRAEGSKDNESITFQTRQGLGINTDVGISYSINKSKVSSVFQKYRKGVKEITDIYLRNMVRDAFVAQGSKHDVEYIYGAGKTDFMKNVQDMVIAQVSEIGIDVEKIYLIGEMRLPTTVVASINAKIGATQKAQQRENEVRQAEAEADKKVADARGEADSILLVAKAQAQANKILSQSLTSNLVAYKSIEKWDGALPYMNGGGAIPMINLPNK